MRVRQNQTAAISRPPIGQQFELGGAQVKLSTGGNLSVKGTSEKLERLGKGGGFRLTVNGESKEFSKLQSAQLFGKAGDDKIRVDRDIGIPVIAKGGAGDDDVKRPRPGLHPIKDQFQAGGGTTTQLPEPPQPPATTGAAFDYGSLGNDDT
jgi:hypothetical protein